jgi:hypothetical protein
MERVQLITSLVKSAISGNEGQVKDLFEQLCESSGCIVKGQGVDLNAISVRAMDLIDKIVESNGQENVKPSLEAIGSLLGKLVISQEPDSPNVIES